MSEKPIIFSGPMVRAILDGRKTQTRRIWSRKQPNRRWWDIANERDDDGWPIGEDDCGRSVRIPCPYGKPGDTLWVRETWVHGLPELGQEPVYYRADGEDDCTVWRPSIHMPRWASRINLKVTNVRVERLQDISEEDVVAEGVDVPLGPPEWPLLEAKDAFRNLWDSINAKRAPWISNPWVWVIEFEREAEGGL